MKGGGQPVWLYPVEGVQARGSMDRLLDVEMTVKLPRPPRWGGRDGLAREGGVLKSLIKLHKGWN